MQLKIQITKQFSSKDGNDYIQKWSN